MTWLAGRAPRDIWWFLLAVLIGNTALASYNLYSNVRNEALVGRSHQVIAALNALLSNLADAETGARGFVISRDPEFLEPYYQSLPGISNDLAVIEDFTKDSEDQRAHLRIVQELMPDRLAAFKRTIEIGEMPARDDAKMTEAVSAGKQIMDKLRERWQLMHDEETRVLRGRERAALYAMRTAIFTTICGGLVSVSAFVLAYRLIRRNEMSRRQAELIVRHSEERFRLMAETLPQLIWITETNGVPEYHNRQWYEYTGIARDATNSFPWRDILHPDDRERSQWRWQLAVSSGEPLEVEYRLRRHDGAYRWFLVRAVPQRAPSGRIVKWFGSSTDIEDQKQAKQQLEEQVRARTAELRQVVDHLHAEGAERERANERLRFATEELSRSNRELEQFAYVASHDLQEPLRKIQTFGDRLKTRCRPQLDDTGIDYLERMHASAGRMRRLIDDLLTFSRVTTRAQPTSTVDLNATLRDVLIDLEDAIERTSGHIDVGPLPALDADPVQMRQMLQNLLSNALKFHKPGEPATIAVRATDVPRLPQDPAHHPDRPGVRLDFIDQGIGFDPAYAERIFQVFQRLHGREAYEGTGIGLAVVRKIAERHNGTVTASSAPGAGATFSVFLPLRASTPIDDNQSARSIMP